MGWVMGAEHPWVHRCQPPPPRAAQEQICLPQPNFGRVWFSSCLFEASQPRQCRRLSLGSSLGQLLSAVRCLRAPAVLRKRAGSRLGSFLPAVARMGPQGPRSRAASPGVTGSWDVPWMPQKLQHRGTSWHPGGPAGTDPELFCPYQWGQPSRLPKEVWQPHSYAHRDPPS